MKMPNSIKYKPTIILIALNIAVYIYTSIIGGNWVSTNFNGIPPLYQLNGDVFYNGAYYQLFTSMFVHASIAHIGGNMLFLWVFGENVEDILGHVNCRVSHVVPRHLRPNANTAHEA